MAKNKKLSKSAAADSSNSSPSAARLIRPNPAPTWLHDGLPLPRLIVLDLDYTLWPFYSDIHVATPVRALSSSSSQQPPSSSSSSSASATAVVADRNGELFSLYPDAPAILRLLASRRPATRLAVASKSPVGDLCRELLKLLRLPAGGGDRGGGPKRTIDAFDAGLEIYEGTKLRHFEVLAKRTGIPFGQMLFFDDERPNLEVESLGVTMRLVRDGLTWEELEKGIRQWRSNQGLV